MGKVPGRQSNKRWWWLIGLAAALVLLFLAADGGHWLRLSTIKAHQAELETWRAAQPLTAALLFFAGYVAVTALSLPGATVMTLAAGALFGLGWGTLIVSLASTLGATLAFLAARWLLAGWVQSRFGDRLATLHAGVARDGAFYLFTLRLVPVLPFFVINLAMGVTRIRPWTFAWVSQLGMLAGTLVYVNAGTQLARITSPADVLSPALLGALVLLGVLPWLARWVINRAQARKLYARWPKPRRFDRNLVVIGGGSAGLVTAYIAAAVRAKVTLVEAHRLGGDCLNTGCVPSKALIRSARLAQQMRDAAKLGLGAVEPQVDFAAVMARVRQVIQAIEPHDSVERYTALGVEVLAGQARLVSPWEVAVTAADGQEQRLTTRAVVIATGAQPTVPDLPGLAEVGWLTSDTVWGLAALPRRLLVLGGGPIGVELAQAFARLGSTVTLVEAAPRLLMREDAEVSALLEQVFADEGITVLTGHNALRFERADGDKQLVAEHAGQPRRIAFDTLLLALGRSAKLSGFGLAELGVATGKTVLTNGLQQTNFPTIYAAGDVAGPWQFTHTAAHQAWYAAVNALFAPLARFKVDTRVIPATTFVEPEVARVGLNALEAQAQGVAFEVTEFPLAELDRAIADGQTRGFVKLLTVPGRDRILGATIVGSHAGELLAEFVLAMKHGIGLNKILGTIHAYPTMAEANKAAAGVWKRGHAPQRLLAAVARWHTWRRG